MSYFIAVQKADGLLDVINVDDFKDGEMIKYESLYIPTYFFTFQNGLKDVQMTDFSARIYCRNNKTKIESSTKMIKSTFGAEYHGFHPGLGCETRGKEHTRQIMKERGLVEAGDTMPNVQKKQINTLDESIVREAVQRGAVVSDNEAKALISVIKKISRKIQP